MPVTNDPKNGRFLPGNGGGPGRPRKQPASPPEKTVISPITPGKGRPTDLTPVVQEKIVQAMLAGNYFETACAYAGVGRTTGFEWLSRGEGTNKTRSRNKLYADFADVIRHAESQAEVRAVTIIQKEMPENARLALDFLARRHPDRWGPKERREISGPEGGPVLVREIVVERSIEKDNG